jgi:hypothetical protein
LDEQIGGAGQLWFTYSNDGSSWTTISQVGNYQIATGAAADLMAETAEITEPIFANIRMQTLGIV